MRLGVAVQNAARSLNNGIVLDNEITNDFKMLAQLNGNEFEQSNLPMAGINQALSRQRNQQTGSAHEINSGKPNFQSAARIGGKEQNQTSAEQVAKQGEE